MRVGIILPHLKKYGGVRRYIEFGNCMVKRGIDYTIYIPIDRNLAPPDWIDYRGRIADVKAMVSDQNDVVICGDAPSCKLLRFAKARLKIVNVIFPVKSNYILGAYDEYINSGDYLVVGNSTGWYDNLEYKPWWYTIPGGVNLDMFRPVEVNRSEEERDKFIVLFMAKDRPWKGFSTILDAIRICDDRDIVFQCFDTEDHPGLNIVKYIDLPQEEMKLIYSKADVFLSAEELAGWCNTAAEAAACRTAIIATEAGTRDFIKDGFSGIVIPKKSPLKIVEAITLLKKNPDLRDKLANNAYQTIQSFSWDIYTDKWLAFLTDKLSDKVKADVITEESVREGFSIVKSLSSSINLEDKSFKSRFTLVYDKSKLTSVKLSREEKEAIKAKANRIREFIDQKPVPKPFDKYEKFGAYHWSGSDKIYESHVNTLISIFKDIKLFYEDDIRTVLDIGCGDGYITKILLDIGFDVIGIDNDDLALRLAKSKLEESGLGDKAKFIKADFFSIKSDSELSNLDIFLASEFIEHLNNYNLFIFKLKYFSPKIVVISTPLKKPDGSMWDPNYHVTEFSEDELLSMFKTFTPKYLVSYGSYAPYHQYVVLERKDVIIRRLIKSISDSTDEDLDMVVKSITAVTSDVSVRKVNLNQS